MKDEGLTTVNSPPDTRGPLSGASGPAPDSSFILHPSSLRYVRLFFAFARFGLINELAFRMNFLVKLTVEVLWFGLLLIFYRTVFRQTDSLEGWSEAQFLCFLGCYYALEGTIETFFLENCSSFSELVRTGNLDTYLLQPIDEQFLVTCRNIDWSTFPNILLGVAVAIAGLVQLPAWQFDLGWFALFLLLFVCGVLMAYSFLLILMSTAVWLVRNQSLMELWWLFTTLMRYPREIYVGKFASPLGWFFSFIVPVLLVVYVPARTMLQVLEVRFVVITAIATGLLLWLSRLLFLRALRSYRSASS